MIPMGCEYTRGQICLLFILIFAAFILWLTPGLLQAKTADALWLSLAPASPGITSPVCELHGAPGAENKERNNQGGRLQKARRFESEHRPSPIRTYYLTGPALSSQAEAYVLQSNGLSKPLKIKYGPQPSVTLRTSMADDQLHGANNVYVIDKQVNDGVLIIQSAKWLVIHHSCGWGHDYRNDKNRKTAHAFSKVPLEIVINGLWDGNFHASARSGDVYDFLVTKAGVPVKGALVTVTTEKQWSRTEVTDGKGVANIQLIRDYYPKKWQNFKRNQQSRFTVTAEYSQDEPGQYNGQPYQQVRYTATFSWKYSPAPADYTSYTFGLALGFVVIGFGGIGIYSFREKRKKPYKGVNLG